MDKSIRRNEHCIIGLPRCDFVFSSTRTCFIAYGFKESTLEMSLLRRILTEHSIDPIEASATLAPGQSAFCTKICSKIITSQFCIVLLNNEKRDRHEFTNANVNMEYGLMLGFNKYVIPFQLASQTLPFNVAGLDTVMYTHHNFEQLATEAIVKAIEATHQVPSREVAPDQNIAIFLLSKRALVASITEQGTKNIYDMGMPLGFNLLHDFSGNNYIYFGNFTMLRLEAILWRIHMLEEIILGRTAILPQRLQDGFFTEPEYNLAVQILNTIQIWVLVTGPEDKTKILNDIHHMPLTHQVKIYSQSDIASELSNLPGA